MAIETICSGCGRKLAVAEENAGKRARCPACGHIYTVPLASSPSGAEDAWSHQSFEIPFSTEALRGPPAGSEAELFWMRSTDGTEYGPVDRQKLHRWFNEGRVGPGYHIRHGEDGDWQPAETYRQSAQLGATHSDSLSNPYADNPYSSPMVGQSPAMYPKGDQGGLILAMGILSFFLCPIFGVVAWIMGYSALKDIAAGRADPKGKGLVQVGYYLGIASVILNLLCIGGYLTLVIIAIVAQA